MEKFARFLLKLEDNIRLVLLVAGVILIIYATFKYLDHKSSKQVSDNLSGRPPVQKLKIIEGGFQPFDQSKFEKKK